ncbi:hypothetical protein [Achromobacter pulmonis]|uniref:hypothetical protein n=1 Tax=Achromobacter pulmonis TaxID=1389932 RepID=UPI003C73901D
MGSDVFEREPTAAIAAAIIEKSSDVSLCQECGSHYVMEMGDSKHSYALATTLWNSGKYRNEFPKLRDLTDAIQMELANYPLDCPECDRHWPE